MSKNVLELLIKADGFVSGEEMSKVLSVSRTAIWKQIKKLKDEGYEIESVNNKGYRVINYPDKFVVDELAYLLENSSLVEEIYVYDTIDSTNKEAKRMATSGKINTAVFIAEEQTVGKGRRGRTWVSPKGTGIYMSLLLRPNINPNNASMLTLIAGLAVSKAISLVTSLECMIKWPNDLVLNNKKVCGILTEMSSEIDYVNYVIVGIGMNINLDMIDKELEDKATSLKIEGNEIYNRKSILVHTIKEFEKLYQQFLKTESLDFILDEYNARCINIGKKVKIENKAEVIIAQTKAVTSKGALLVETENNELMSIQSGEVSVRGLYGYVD